MSDLPTSVSVHEVLGSMRGEWFPPKRILFRLSTSTDRH